MRVPSVMPGAAVSVAMSVVPVQVAAGVQVTGFAGGQVSCDTAVSMTVAPVDGAGPLFVTIIS